MAALDPGTLLGGDFRIVGPLSAGGMGAVYIAEQLSVGRKRALKVMHRELLSDAKLRERFVQEAKVGATIDSEHVVEVVAAGVDERLGVPWLAMELLEGKDLASVIDARGALPASEVAEVLDQLCHALAAAHAVGVVHRDLKPENVFIARSRRRGGSFEVKVLDFGIAKVVAEARATSAGTAALGTPLYMAPEQTEARGMVTPAADVWALGLIAFRALTGRHFWLSAHGDSPSITALMREVIIDAIPAASVRAAAHGVPPYALPAGFDAWFGRCVARDPAARFANAGAAFEAIGTQGWAPVAGGTAAPTPATIAIGLSGMARESSGALSLSKDAVGRVTTSRAIEATVAMPRGSEADRVHHLQTHSGRSPRGSKPLPLLIGMGVLILGSLLFFVLRSNSSKGDERESGRESADSRTSSPVTNASPPSAVPVAPTASPPITPPMGSESGAVRSTPGAAADEARYGKSTASSSAATVTSTAPTIIPAKKPVGSGCKTLEECMGGEVKSGTEATPDTPDTPDRNEMRDAILGRRPIATACVAGLDGTSHVVITFSPEGTVADVMVDTGPAMGTAAEACIRGAFATAKVMRSRLGGKAGVNLVPAP